MTNVLVTGAASGIGAAVTDRLGRDGFDVVGWDVAEASPERVDVSDPRAIEAAADRLPIPLHGAVLAAGVSDVARLVDTTDEQWRRQMDVNAFGVFACLRAVLPRIARGGSVVVVSSMGGLRAAEYLGAYCASKFATLALVETAALEHAAAGIRVNAVCPMYVRTPMQERELLWEGQLRGMPAEEVRARYVDDTPLGWIAEPDEVADVVAFLISSESRYVTGASIRVTGGADL